MPEHLSIEMMKVRTEAESFMEELIQTEQSLRPESTESEWNEARRKVRQRSQDLGLFYKTQAEEYGGNPASVLELTMLRELFASANLSITDAIFGPGPGILGQSEGEMKTRYLEPVLRGEKRGAFGFTEPDTAERPTWAIQEGEDLIINGCKSFVTGGDTADFISVLVEKVFHVFHLFLL